MNEGSAGPPGPPPLPIREQRSRRLQQRLRLPLTVVVDGRDLQALDWSLGGFAVAAPPAAWRRGTRLRAHLLFPLHDSHWGFFAEAEVVTSVAGRRAGLRFLDLRPGQLAALGWLMSAALAGQVVTLDSILAATGDRPPPPPDAMPPPEPASARFARRLGLLTLILAGAAVLAGLLSALHTRLLTVQAVHAAATVPVIAVRAPVDGVPRGPALRTGDAVAAGAALFDMAGEVLLSEIELAEADLAGLTQRVEALRRRLADLDTFFADYRRLAQAAVKRAEAGLAESAETLRLSERELARLEDLRVDGHVAEARVEQAVQKRAAARRGALAAQAALDEARANLALTRHGRYFTGSRVEGGDPARLAEDIARAEDAQAMQSRRLAALLERRESLRVVSPCDCIVALRQAHPEEWLRAGSLLYLLRTRSEHPVVTALVPREQARLLGAGHAAVLRLPDRPDAEAGTVETVSHLPQVAGLHGLSAELFERFASVTIRLPAGRADTLAPGMPAQVLLPVPFGAALFAWIGWN